MSGPAVGFGSRSHHGALEAFVMPAAHSEAGWLRLMSSLAGLEFIWWWVLWRAGTAPALHLSVYLTAAIAGLASAMALRTALGLRPLGADWRAVAAGTLLIGCAASMFLPLKVAIPAQVSFWLDPHLASAETFLFGAPPWRLLDRALGWATGALDWLYGGWLPLQLLAVFLVILARPSPQKSRALAAYSLAWLALGVVAAALFASVGPIFYDRAFGGHTFEGVGATLRARGARIVIAESDLMWASLAMDRPGLVAGVSAMPSLHVAISVWLVLAARALAPPFALAAAVYAVIIGIASVQLGWHYVSDGVFGAFGMIAIWRMVCRFQRGVCVATTEAV